MVEKIIVSPGDVRGLGNIVDPKLVGDFETELCVLDEDTEVIQSTVLSIYTMSYSNINITLATSSASVTFGGSITLTATVLDGNTAVSGVTVYFKYGADIIGTGTTNSSGKATTTYTPSLGGSYSFIATYAGKVSEPVTVTVNKINPSVSLALANSYVYEGENLVCTATVTYQSEGLAGLTVSFKEGTTILGTGVTDSNGVVTFTTNTLQLGNHSIVASTTATEVYNSVNSSSKTAHIIADNELTIQNFTVNMRIGQNMWREYGDEGTVTCFTSYVNQAIERLTVKTKNGKPVQGITVKFYHDDELVGSSLTNQKGIVSRSISAGIQTWPDEFVLSAVAEGTDYYTGCSKEYNTLIKETETTLACEDYVS